MPERKTIPKMPKPRCASCGSSQTYIRIKTNERHCNECGYDQPLMKKRVAA